MYINSRDSNWQEGVGWLLQINCRWREKLELALGSFRVELLLCRTDRYTARFSLFRFFVLACTDYTSSFQSNK